MSIYYGVVKNNVVILPKDIQLAEGLIVEIHIPPAEHEQPEPSSSEEQFKQILANSGLLQEIKLSSQVPPVGDRTPIQVRGKPLSRVIIEERR